MKAEEVFYHLSGDISQLNKRIAHSEVRYCKVCGHLTMQANIMEYRNQYYSCLTCGNYLAEQERGQPDVLLDRPEKK